MPPPPSPLFSPLAMINPPVSSTGVCGKLAESEAKREEGGQGRVPRASRLFSSRFQAKKRSLKMEARVCGNSTRPNAASVPLCKQSSPSFQRVCQFRLAFELAAGAPSNRKRGRRGASQCTTHLVKTEPSGGRCQRCTVIWAFWAAQCFFF
ncbi:hypothetical protein GQ53DRAFT_117543 [Thozetella sp. PMI_491]|nr:hypothetical protein GQ53DRAFT_117543 [Thozetella sp. PMI_491]